MLYLQAKDFLICNIIEGKDLAAKVYLNSANPSGFGCCAF